MSKKRKRISRRRLAGQRVMSHVPIFHLGTGQHKPVTAARRFIAEEGLYAPAILMFVVTNTLLTDSFGEKKAYLVHSTQKRTTFFSLL